MLSPQIRILGLAFWIVLTVSCAASIQLYPKFKVRLDSESTASFPAPYFSSGKFWVPTSPTIFYQTENSSSFTLDATIENAPSRDMQFDVYYRCRSETELENSLTLIDEVMICEDDWHVRISVAQVTWASASSVRLLFKITLSTVVLADLKALLENSQTLKLFITFQGKLQLQGNVILIKKWHWVDAISRKDIFQLTEAAEHKLVFAKLSPFFGFDSVSLFETKAYNFVSRRPGLESSLLSFGVLLQFNTGSFLNNEKHLRYMSSNYPHNLTSLDSKILRVVVNDQQRNIMVHYSRLGLKRAVAQLLTEHKERECSSSTYGCVSLSGCNLFFNIWLPTTYKRDCQMTHILDRWQYMWPASGPEPDECKVVDGYQRNVVIYAGAPYTVPCPIICSMLDAPYAFYKGGERMQTWILEAGKEFVQYGAVSVHRSGAAIVFDKSATYYDSGEYKCVAGEANRAEATFKVQVVALPVFNVSGTELVGGYLPPKIYLFEGDKYSVNCTVFYSGMNEVSLTPKFFVVTNRSALHDWSEMNGPDFATQLSTVGSRVDISVTSNSFSTTLTLTVDKVPQITDRFDFSHRFVCVAEASHGDVSQFGLPSYGTESGSDVVVLQQPLIVVDDFKLSGGACCREKCPAEECTFEISLKPSIYGYLKAAGIEVRGEFVQQFSVQQAGLRDWTRKNTAITLDNDTVKLQWKMNENMDQLSVEKRAVFFGLVAVFTFFSPMGTWGGLPTKMRIDRCRSAGCTKSADACSSDPSCVFSTAMSSALSETLAVSTLLNLPTTFLDVEDPTGKKPAAKISAAVRPFVVIVGFWLWWSRFLMSDA